MVFTIVAILLLDKVGRRPLLITGTVIAGIALLGLAAYFGFSSLQDNAPWLALVSLLVFIAGYAIGLGPVFWLMISEIFPQRLRSKAMSVTTVANWLANFAASATFLTLAGAITRQGIFSRMPEPANRHENSLHGFRSRGAPISRPGSS